MSVKQSIQAYGLRANLRVARRQSCGSRACALGDHLDGTSTRDASGIGRSALRRAGREDRKPALP